MKSSIKKRVINRMKRLGLIDITMTKKEARLRGLKYLSVYLTLLPVAAHADFAGTLTSVYGYMTGSLSVVIVSTGIVALGYLTVITGQVPKKYLVAAVVGAGFVFGAGPLVTLLKGGL